MKGAFAECHFKEFEYLLSVIEIVVVLRIHLEERPEANEDIANELIRVPAVHAFLEFYSVSHLQQITFIITTITFIMKK